VNTVYELLKNNAIPLLTKIELNAVGENQSKKNQAENRKVIFISICLQRTTVKVEKSTLLTKRNNKRCEES
jgi:hypothetical protein